MKKKLTFMIVGGLVAVTFIFASLLHKHLFNNKKSITNNIELEDKTSINDYFSEKNVENSSNKSIELDKNNDNANNLEEKNSNSSDNNCQSEYENHEDNTDDINNSYETDDTEINNSCEDNSVYNLKPTSPSNAITKPVVKPTSPSNAITKPVVKPTSPSNTVTKPVVKPTSPSNAVTKPVVKPTSPSNAVTKPVVKPTSPSNAVTKPVVKPTSPSNTVTKPVVKPTSPSNTVTKSVVKPTSPSNTVTKPVVKPTSPNNAVTKPVVKPTSPSNAVTKPVVKPTSSSNAITKPVVKPTSKTKNPSLDEVQQAIFKIVNRERAKAGKPKLSYDKTMEKYAIIKSKDMAVRNYFDHADPEGNFINKQMKEDGIKYMAWGENIISRQGQIKVDELAEHFMDRWMHSPGHRANILSDNFKTIGVGLYRIGDDVYGTQEFCRY